MRKILPLVSLLEVDNYMSNGVDAVLMGTVFSSQAQMTIYDLDEITQTQEKIPVIALFNRDFKQHEKDRLIHEIKALYELNVDSFLIQDEFVLEVLNELDLDIEIIFKHNDTFKKHANVDEYVLNKIKDVDSPFGIHFFGHQYLKTEVEGEEMPFVLKDEHGFHHFSEGITSIISKYDKIKEKNVKSIYFEPFGSNIDDVLFVVRSLDLMDDYELLEEIVKETINKETEEIL